MYLSNFVNWVESQPSYSNFQSNPKGWSIDKDIIRPNNRIYCYQFCILTTVSENSIDVNKRKPNYKAMHTKSSRLKASNSRRVSVIGISLVNNQKFLCLGINSIEDYGFCLSCVRSCLNKQRKTHRGYRWYKVNYKHNKIYRIKGCFHYENR